MKKRVPIFSRAAFLTALFLAAIPRAPAADEDAASAPPKQVRVDVLILSMPEEKFLTFLPDLLDKNKIEKAVPALLEAVKRKEVVLEGYSMVVAKRGLNGHTATTMDPVSPPPNAQPYAEPDAIWRTRPYFTPGGEPTPVSYEVRPLGVEFEAESVVSPDGRIIDIYLALDHTELLGYENFPPSKRKDIKPTWDNGPGQPIYFTTKVVTAITLHSGQHLLLAVHKKDKPEGAIEIFIVHAETIPVGK